VYHQIEDNADIGCSEAKRRESRGFNKLGAIGFFTDTDHNAVKSLNMTDLQHQIILSCNFDELFSFCNCFGNRFFD